MSGTAIPLAQFAQQLAAAGAGADLSAWTAGIAGGNTQRSLATAFADLPFIEWFGPCGLGGDDTAVFSRAVQSGLPFRLAPKTYVVNGSWNTGAVPSLTILGTPGQSRLLRMEGGSSGAWIGLQCPTVIVDGVIFDANGAQVSAGTWNVLVDSEVSEAIISRCAFRNNSGALGRGLAILGGAAAIAGSGTYAIDDCEFSANSSDGCAIFGATGVCVTRSRAFGNGGSGIAASVFGEPTPSNMVQRVLLQGNSCWNNAIDGINFGTLNPTNSSPPVYTLGAPSQAIVSIVDNFVWQNGSYGIQAYGDYLDIGGNQLTQTSQAAGGIVVTARFSRISRNTLNVPGVYIGIDSGGCYDCDLDANSVTGASIGINPGGSQFVSVTGNRLRGCGIGMSVYNIEADGNGVPFPAPVTGLTVERNVFLIGEGQTGISILDGAAGVSVVDNRFVPVAAGVGANQAISLRTGSALIRGNMWAGADRIDLNPSPQNLLEVPDILDTIRIPAGGEVIDSLVPASVATSVGQISYLVVTDGGSGYTQANVSLSGSGLSGQVTAMVYGGSVIGFRVTNNGSLYTPGSTTCTITGNGTGASAAVVVGTPLQTGRRMTLLAESGVTLKQHGQTMTQLNSTMSDLLLPPYSAVECIESNGGWIVAGFYPAALLQSAANGDVTLASPGGSSLSLLPGDGTLIAPNLPTSAAGLTAGAVWRNGTTLNIV